MQMNTNGKGRRRNKQIYIARGTVLRVKALQHKDFNLTQGTVPCAHLHIFHAPMFTESKFVCVILQVYKLLVDRYKPKQNIHFQKSYHTNWHFPLNK